MRITDTYLHDIQVLELEIITGCGDKLTANEQINPDLYWGARGGLTNFGIVTSFTCRLHEKHNDVTVGAIGYSPSQLQDLLDVIDVSYSILLAQ